MNSISSYLLNSLNKILQKCSAFESEQSLRNLFVDSSIAMWSNEIVGATSRKERVNNIVTLLYNKTNDQGENGLVLFLHVLRQQINLGDGLKEKIGDLEDKLAKELNKNKSEATIDNFTPVKFVNRALELNLVFNSQLFSQHWLIDGPPGYGKTELLLEIKCRYEKLEWITSYIEISRSNPPEILALANKLIGDLGSHNFCEETMGAQRIGRRIAGCLLQAIKHSINGRYISTATLEHRGATLLFDNIEVLSEQTLTNLAELISGTYDGLRDSGFFNKQNRFVVIFSGRDSRRKASSLRAIKITEIPLSPYTFNVVLQTLRHYTEQIKVILTEQTYLNTAAYLMYLSGGHPGCIADSLMELAKEQFAAASFVLQEQSEDFLRKIFPILDNLEDYGADIYQLIPVLETLSVFRRFGTWLLQALIDDGYINWKGDVYHLEDVLLETYLLRENKGFLQDSITQRLFAIRLRFNDLAKFQELCRYGISVYQKRLRSESTYPLPLAVECLYLQLQYIYFVEQKRGDDFREAVTIALVQIIHNLAKGRSIRAIIRDFPGFLRNDWEIEFYFNYFSSEGTYTHDSYEKLLQKVMAVFDVKNRSRGG